MSNYIVVNNLKKWQFNIPGVEVISARDYLSKAGYIRKRGSRIFNLCKTYRYQSIGYYVSLIALARGHKAFPDINTIQEMKAPHVIRVIAGDIDTTIQRSLAHLQSESFTLSIYFGKNVSKKYDWLSSQIYRLFQAPLLRVYFIHRNGKWRIQSIQLISTHEIPEEHHDYVIRFATEFFSRKKHGAKRKPAAPYDLAILADPSDKTPPSNKKAVEKFIKAGEKTGFNVEIIGKDDMHRLAEFDALFIRETTAVNHHTFRFSQRAAAEGLVVIDDPESIIKCTNKVYLAELLQHYQIPAPGTAVISRETAAAVPGCMGFPIILKQPDSSYSQGVIKIDSIDGYNEIVNSLLDKSELIIAQEFIPTEYDWRIGVLDGEPLYACRYYMAEDHWQVINWSKKHGSSKHEGKSDTIPVEDVPRKVINAALKASGYIGKGLYGVDLKIVGRRCFVIEINDNPSIDCGLEDFVLKDELYNRIMNVFFQRVKRMKEANFPQSASPSFERTILIQKGAGQPSRL
ncbi:MAG TPA: RimK family protein [Spirochaetota bacterium]|nr:RimK family protein [Spirochaetota bacterium]HPJ35219.1 RimK family protein [Spirochaetota bacterium]